MDLTKLLTTVEEVEKDLRKLSKSLRSTQAISADCANRLEAARMEVLGRPANIPSKEAAK